MAYTPRTWVASDEWVADAVNDIESRVDAAFDDEAADRTAAIAAETAARTASEALLETLTGAQAKADAAQASAEVYADDAVESRHHVAAVAPTVNDDANDGYIAGSHWTDTTTGYSYVCTDATAGAAVWKIDAGLSAPVVPYSESLISTFDFLNVSTSFSAQSANELRLQRVMVPKTGRLRDLAVFVGVGSGNIEASVFDTAGTLARQYASGTVAAVGGSAWQIVGDPNLAVTRGQHLILGIGADNATVTLARVNGNMAAAALGALPFSIGGIGAGVRTTFRTLSNVPAPATIVEGSMTNVPAATLIIGRIS